MKRGALALLALAIACGGSTPDAAEPEEGEGAAELIERAAQTWGALDPENAARLAERALRIEASDDAREIAARSYLALGRYERAERVLEGANDGELLRLRARAQMERDHFADAVLTLEAAARHARDPDPWAESVLPALRAVGESGAYTFEGDAEVELALEDRPLPVVRVRVDARETFALIGSGADFIVVDPSLRNASGAIDELALGRMRIRNVPFVARSLAPVREVLGEDIGCVIGADLLMRTSATLDGPHARAVFRAAVPARAPTTAAPIFTPGGFLAVPVAMGERGGWMTVDTSGLFPIAIGPGAVELYGLEGTTWAASDPPITVIDEIRIGDLIVERMTIVDGLLDESHARAVGAPIAGSIGWILLSELTISFDPRTRRLRFE